jgi:F-type H+-transporting ATPase subunit epsilon
MSAVPAGRLALKVVTPRGLEVEAEVLEVGLPSLDGVLGILPGHRPMFVVLGRGVMTYRNGTSGGRLDIRGGTAEVRPDSVLAFAELSDEEDERSPA